MIKQKKSMLQQVSNLFGAGFERLLYLILVSIMVCHIFACLWVFIAQMSNEGESSWMDGDVSKMDKSDQYVTSFYFIITTFSTVGYGDMSANNFSEKIFCILVMCLGVTAFAAGTGTLTNLL